MRRNDFLKFMAIYIDKTPIRFDAAPQLQTWLVPRGVHKIHVECVGAKGMSSLASGYSVYPAGNGGKVDCLLKVTPNTSLFLYAGFSDPNTTSNTATPINNSSDIRTTFSENVNDLTSNQSRLVVAGGGGNGANSYFGGGSGGLGGGLVGGNGGGGYLGYGGTQTAGGGFGGAGLNAPGSSGGFPLGGAAGGWHSFSGGAGGAGWYGGGGAGCYPHHTWYGNTGAGGGGSSYTHQTLCSEVVHTQGANAGNGYIIITPVG